MKINLGNSKPKLELKKGSKINRSQKTITDTSTSEEEKLKYREVRKEIMNNMAETMRDDFGSVEMSEEDRNIANKKYRNMKIKRLLMYSSIITLMLGMFVFGFYRTFIKKDLTGREIAIMANYYNNQTNFPIDGIDGFLNFNKNTLIRSNLKMGDNVEKINISNPIITRINTKSDSIANVYFYVDTHSNIGTVRVNCMLPVLWDQKSDMYFSAGNVIVTPNESTVSSQDIKENSFLSFENIQRSAQEDIDNAKTFVNNMMNMLYSGQDISPYYKGTKLNTEDMKYEGLSEFIMYESDNKNGYNASFKISLSMSNGLLYTTEKYMKISKTSSGETWIVIGIL